MPQYEFILDIVPVSEDIEDFLMSTWDCSLGGHGSITLLTITAEGPSAECAFRRIVHELEKPGVRVRRLVEDLVTRKAIALRADVTPQAVGLWIRRERQHDTPFPEPYVLAGGGLWLWGEVAAWLEAKGCQDDALMYPTREDHVRCSMWLLDSRSHTPPVAGTATTSVTTLGVPMTPRRHTPASWIPVSGTAFAASISATLGAA